MLRRSMGTARVVVGGRVAGARAAAAVTVARPLAVAMVRSEGAARYGGGAVAASRAMGTAAGAKTDTFLPQDQVTERVLSVVKSFPKVDAKKVTPTANFETDLGLDSLDTVELVMLFEEEFVLTIPDDQAEKILTVADAIKFICAHPQAR